MSYYTRDELLSKSYESLYKIAIDEKLINVYMQDKTKVELIELILKYRKNLFFEKIIQNDVEGFVRLQEIFDKKVQEIYKDETDIEVPHSITLYKNKRINADEGYYILINKDILIDSSFVLLIGKNGYIYVIFSLTLDSNYNNSRYNKYMFDNKYVDRLNFDLEFLESTKLIFFEQNFSKILKDIYSNKAINYSPEKIFCYSKKIFEFKVKKLKKINRYFPTLFIDNKIITKYFVKNFGIYIRKIEDNHIYIEFFDEANITLKQKNYIFNGTYFDNMSDFFSKQDAEIKIYDDYLRFKKISKKSLIITVLNEILSEIISFSKCDYIGMYIIGVEDIDIKNFISINLAFAVNYGLIRKKISQGISCEKSDNYLIFCSQYDNLNISINNYNFNEKDINYDISIHTFIQSQSFNINYNKILKMILNLLKIKIAKIEYEHIPFNELMEKINSNEYFELALYFKKKYIEAEKIYSTDYKKYENERNDLYLKVKKNYYSLLFDSEKIFDLYCKDINFNDIYLDDYKININRNEIEFILSLEIYNFLNNFFKKYTVLELLSNYKAVKLIGQIVKSNLFYSILKEFIPGKMIRFSENNEKNYKNILDTIDLYIEDMETAKVHCNYLLKKEKKDIEVLVNTFKEEYVVVINTKSKTFGYIDKLEKVTKLNVIFKLLETNQKRYESIFLQNNFYEKDENNTKIEQIYLDDIDNGIVRVFFLYTDKLVYKCAKRQQDQVYVSDEIELNLGEFDI